MSLAIDPDDVTQVLLADGWHWATNGLWLDAYEYVAGDDIVHGGGGSGVCATGFAFEEFVDGEGTFRTYGPLTAILAVRVSR